MMSDTLLFIGAVVVLLVVGYPVYRLRWPDGFWSPPEDDEKLERIRRIGRRRVLPLPLAREQRRRHQDGVRR